MPSVEEVNNFRYSLTALKRVMPELSGLPRRERALLRQIVEMLESRLASQERAIAAKAKPKPIPNLSVKKTREQVLKAIERKHQQVREARIEASHRKAKFRGLGRRVPGSACSNER
jgi:hypothetical protein